MRGIWTNQNAYVAGFTEADQQQNAREIWGFFEAQGWTLESVSGMLGNMEVESFINPAQWEQNYPIYGAGGFGLVQWTPWSKFSDWAGSDWESNYRKQLQRIQWELDNGEQWIPVAQDGYMSFYDFTQSTLPAPDLAMVFERGYERGTPMESVRRANAQKWYDYLGGSGPTPPVSPPPIWLLFKMKERYTRYGRSNRISRP